MTTHVPPGWVGGFAQSNPAFTYPDPDLSSLPVLGNLDNIPKIQRQQAVQWPEFSWETTIGDGDSRCFQMFAHDISRLGYDDTGRVWSIICPQQGVYIPSLEGSLNVEVTVTGQRGWADETNREMAADMSVEGTIWFSPNAHQHWLVKQAWKRFEAKGLPFPSTKAQAVKVTTHKVGDPGQPLFDLRDGVSAGFTPPEFATHPEAWTVANLEVQIGPIQRTGHEAVDAFNEKVLDIFNMGSGNMLADTNVLTWNVWFTPPQLVDTEEWASHAERWRHSIDQDHCSPDGSVSSPARFADGTPFVPAESHVKEFEDFLGLIWDLL